MSIPEKLELDKQRQYIQKVRKKNEQKNKELGRKLLFTVVTMGCPIITKDMKSKIPATRAFVLIKI